MTKRTPFILRNKKLLVTAFAAAIGGVAIHSMRDADFMGIGLEANYLLNTIGEPVDYFNDSALEKYVGDRGTTFLQDQDFARLIKAEPGRNFNTALENRILDFFDGGNKEIKELIQTIQEQQPRSLDYWANTCTLLIYILSSPGNLPPEFGYTFQKALSYTIGAPNSPSQTINDLVDYARDKYIKKGASLIKGENLTQDEIAARNSLLDSMLGYKAPTNRNDMLEAMFKVASHSITSKPSPVSTNSFSMRIALQYIKEEFEIPDNVHLTTLDASELYLNWKTAQFNDKMNYRFSPTKP